MPLKSPILLLPLAPLVVAAAFAGCGASTGIGSIALDADASSIDALADTSSTTDTSTDTPADYSFADAASTSARAVAVGPSFACALLASGLVDCWGAIFIGNPPTPSMCGGTNSCFTTPVQMPGFSHAVAIAAGNGYICGVLEQAGAEDGSSATAVECLGDNVAGELGSNALYTAYSTTPMAVQSLYGVTAITAGGRHTCTVLGDRASASAGTVQCWGDDEFGELGNGSLGPDQCGSAGACALAPVAVENLSQVVSVAAGVEHTCALLSGGSVACWGDNSYGELGNGGFAGPDTCGTLPCAQSPVMVPNLSGVASIAAGGYHSCAVLTDRTVECWGRNDSGELGLGLATGPQSCLKGTYCATAPTPVPGLTGVVALALGNAHSCALLADRTVQCWGLAGGGELGNGNSTGPDACNGASPPAACSTSPVKVSALDHVVQLAAGSLSSCAVLSNGTVDCWGDNTLGELGDGTSEGPEQCAGAPCSTTPVLVGLGL